MLAGPAELSPFDTTNSYPSLALASNLLARSGLRVAVAESCTGGLLGAALTSVSGSSAYVLGGVISYDDSVKTSLLGVPQEIIIRHGAVSEQCARAMAVGVRRLLSADISISITGISGPLGGSTEKPVGLTFICLIAPGIEQVQSHVWQGDRAQNRANSVEAALSLLAEYLQAQPDTQNLLATSRQPKENSHTC